MHLQQAVDFLATAAARLEESAYPNAAILPNFPRSIQLDYHSCGVHCVLSILRFYNKRVSFRRLKKLLRTNEDGTSATDIRRVFKTYELECRTIRDLKAAIDDGCPVLISMWDGEHYAVVYGYSSSMIFVMNPSLDASSDGVGSLTCAVSKRAFRRSWDRWAMVIRKPR
jgi:ABC-type bacteriocin/lantibiotic exporter with double-glycine peptidase domain